MLIIVNYCGIRYYIKMNIFILKKYIMYDLWRKEYNGSLQFKGHGVAGCASSFWIPQFRLMFDAGLLSPYQPKYICITHTHADHIQNLLQL